jgi:transcriptional regulator with XRE-family HTH domain
VTDEHLDEPSPAHRRLAERLRELRQAAGLTGGQLAERAGLSQPKVSRVETARQAPQMRDVEAWLAASAAPDDVRAELTELAEVVLTEVSAWRRELRGGRRGKQERIGREETAASIIRYWTPLLVPGLLQTAEYARRNFGYATHAPWDLAEAVQARLDRQAVLFDVDKRVVLLVGEAALRRRLGPRQVHLGQIDRINSLLDLSNVEIGLVPFDFEATTLDYHEYNIYGDPETDEDVLVTVSTITDELRIRDAEKVARYLDHFERVRAGAVTGAEARALLNRVSHDLLTSD